MNTKDEEFLKRIQATFRIEADEHLKVFSAELNELGRRQTKKKIADIIDTLFREIHSLKGAARSVDQKEIEAVCHPVEGLLSDLKRHGKSLSQSMLDVLFMANERLLNLISTSGSAQSVSDRQLQMELTDKINEVNKGNAGEDKTKHVAEIQPVEGDPTQVSGTELIRGNPDPAPFGFVRVPITRLEPLLLQAEELIQIRIAGDQRLLELKGINSTIANWKTIIQDYKRQRSEQKLENIEENLFNLETSFSELTRSFVRDQYNQGLIINDHLGDLKHLLMLPVSTIVESFPAMVRKISRQQHKEIELIIRGQELVIDKRILEDLKDPLIHLIRNSIDHGISIPSERIRQNKSSHGTITLSFTARDSGMIEIIVSDDGKGINIENLLHAAIKSGNISGDAGKKLKHEEILSLIFQQGVTTNSIITDISGRGIGLSIVREKVEKLHGRVSVETDGVKGTTFIILLPMSLSTFRGVLVRIAEYRFIMPTMNVDRVLEAKSEMIKTIENHETIMIDNQIIPLSDLGEALGINQQKISDSTEKVSIIVVASGDNRIAFRVDEIIEELQILVKGLGKLLKHVRNISGATILGSGKVVPVLQITDLIKSALNSSERFKSPPTSERKVERIRNILVAEDSITARTLLKNILESAGYTVSTAVDGSDAIMRLRSKKFDLVVSDIDMPGLNGFELTQKIRDDKKLKETPVVLVTALESREDRERGIEVGADAYIIKSSFDQNNLLQIIKKLI